MINAEVVNGFPPEARGGHGQTMLYREYYEEIGKHGVGEYFKMLMPNKKTGRSVATALASAPTSITAKLINKKMGEKFSYRLVPVNGKPNGEYYLYVVRLNKDQVALDI